MKVALYARKSKPDPTWRPSFEGELPPTSVETQVKRLQAAATAAGHEVVLVEVDQASGSNPNRPGWRRIMASVDGAHVGEVWMTRSDRAMRSTKHYLDVVERFVKRSVALVFLDQPELSVRGKGSAQAVAFRTVSAAFNQLHLDLAREASMEVLERDPEDGKLYGPRSELPAGRPVEYGPEHKFRKRADGTTRHDKARCRACRGQTGGVGPTVSATPENGGVAIPGGLATPETVAAHLSDGADAAGAAGAGSAEPFIDLDGSP
jgi:DNA invertase Pin-like site-specific DNA recombinase